MKTFFLKYKYPVTFLLYIFLIIYLSRNAELVFEWVIIMRDFAIHGDYYYYGKPTAHMPPLYPYYLLVVQSISPADYWTVVSCIIQSVIYFFSVKFLTQTFEKLTPKAGNFYPAFAALLFFPPILTGLTKISSFALTVSIFCIFIGLIVRVNSCFCRRTVIFTAVISVLGMYIRYEFIFLMLFSAMLLAAHQKIKIRQAILVLPFVFLVYLPWCIRNYQKIGVFHYSTSLNYNFAKGNHVRYNVLSSANLPYDPQKDLVPTDDYLREHFHSEKEIDAYMESLGKQFTSEHRSLFLVNSLKKIGINFTNYYPGNYNFSGSVISWLYAGFLTAFNLLFLFALAIRLREKSFITIFTGVLFLFFLIFYSVAPLPRYYLLYFPVFFLFVYQHVRLHRHVRILNKNS